MNEACDALVEWGISTEWLVARGLCAHPEAIDLVVAETGADGREHRLTPPAAAAWQAMKLAAGAENVVLTIISAHRSIARQDEIVRRKLARGETLEDILKISAPPGYSEHHSGRAVDIATPGVPLLVEEFDTTLAFAWLQERAGSFGFRLSYPRGNRCGFHYEPWHWCWHAAP